MMNTDIWKVPVSGDQSGVTFERVQRQEQKSASSYPQMERSLPEKQKSTTISYLDQVSSLIKVPDHFFPDITGHERHLQYSSMQRLVLDRLISKTFEKVYLVDSEVWDRDVPEHVREQQLKIRKLVSRDFKARLYPFHCEYLPVYQRKDGGVVDSPPEKVSQAELANLTAEELKLFKQIKGSVSLYFAENLENLIDDKGFEAFQRQVAEQISVYWDEADKCWKERTVILMGIGGYTASGKEGLQNRSMKSGLLVDKPIATGTAGIVGHVEEGYQEWEDFFGIFNEIKSSGRLIPDKITMLAVSQHIQRDWGKYYDKNVPIGGEGFPRGKDQTERSLYRFVVERFGPEKVKYFYMILSPEMQAVRYMFRIIDSFVGEKLGWVDAEGNPVRQRADDLNQFQYASGTVESFISNIVGNIFYPAFIKSVGIPETELTTMDPKNVKKLLLDFQIAYLRDAAYANALEGKIGVLREDMGRIKSRWLIDVSTHGAIKSQMEGVLGIHVREVMVDNCTPAQTDTVFRELVLA